MTTGVLVGSMSAGVNGTSPALGLNGTALNGTLAGKDQPTPEEIRNSIIVFYIVLFVLMGAQGGLYAWRKYHRRSYELASLVGLWVIPPIISFELGFYRFLLAWAVYSAISGFHLYLCYVGPLSKDLPLRIYRWFSWVFTSSIVLGVTGYILLLLEALALGPLLRAFLSPGACLTVLWYGLYFGILTRDMAEVASDRIAVTMGQRRRLAVSVRNCGICSGELEDAPGASAPARGAIGAGRETVQLSCKHLFHSDCIRGWTIVGKKDVCPTCHEKVDLRKLYASRPWESRNISWNQMLDMVRFLVVWNPLILTFLHFLFHWTGLERTAANHGAGGAALGLNATLLNATSLNATGLSPLALSS